jgi:DNA-binding NarL/FixJ family response regulator
VDAAEREDILGRYAQHARRFRMTTIAAHRPEVEPTQSAAAAHSGPVAGQQLTARELRVLELVADGLVNREIGQRLYLSEETIKSHIRRMLTKLQATSRAHAVAVGFRNRLIA